MTDVTATINFDKPLQGQSKAVESPTRRGLWIKCLQCDGEFRTYPSRIKIGLGKFCHKDCADKYRIGRYKPWLGKKRPDLINTNAARTMFTKGHEPWNKDMDWIEMQGSNNPAYKNGRFLNISNGYMIVSIKGVHKLEHRAIMENFLNRKLSKNEHVHHIDGDKTNNHIDNLIVLSPQEHLKVHLMIDPMKNIRAGFAGKGKSGRRKKEVVSNVHK